MVLLQNVYVLVYKWNYFKKYQFILGWIILFADHPCPYFSLFIYFPFPGILLVKISGRLRKKIRLKLKLQSTLALINNSMRGSKGGAELEKL